MSSISINSSSVSVSKSDKEDVDEEEEEQMEEPESVEAETKVRKCVGRVCNFSQENLKNEIRVDRSEQLLFFDFFRNSSWSYFKGLPDFVGLGSILLRFFW
jgi:hypothetical protein